ncbi:MAG TPA: shikimate dehydrogenase [Anaerolineales bacterium]|nr:shikimate dehydrogenase [Anaerolineales bacterium]HRF49483.1 shikimate dehydrogenase [Anaerolineales bacterium]
MHLFLFGDPLGHTLSPAMHNAALAEVGLGGWHYTPRPVRTEDLGFALAELRRADVAGANVTVPHKQAVIPYLDGLTPTALALGAVNTIVKEGGRLLGHNTDAAGLLADLATNGARLTGARVLVLGAGGSARAAVGGLLGVGAAVRVLARRPEQAEALQVLGPIEIYPWTPLGFLEASDDVAVVINTTPLGMHPRVDASPWLEGTPWPVADLVYDLVYNPAETLFVRQARAQGLRAATGLGMLVEQGALAFELWTGQTAPRAVMRRAAEATLGGAR